MEITKEQWHLRKEFSLGTLLVLAVYGISAIMMMTRMDERVGQLELNRVAIERIAIAETNIIINRESIRALEERNQRALDEIKATLGRIEARIHDRTRPIGAP